MSMMAYRTSSFSSKEKDDEFLSRYIDDDGIKYLASKKGKKEDLDKLINKYSLRSYNKSSDLRHLSKYGLVSTLGLAGGTLAGYGLSKALKVKSPKAENAALIAGALGGIATSGGLTAYRDIKKLKRLANKRVSEVRNSRKKFYTMKVIWPDFK